MPRGIQPLQAGHCHLLKPGDVTRSCSAEARPDGAAKGQFPRDAPAPPGLSRGFPPRHLLHQSHALLPGTRESSPVPTSATQPTSCREGKAAAAGAAWNHCCRARHGEAPTAKSVFWLKFSGSDPPGGVSGGSRHQVGVGLGAVGLGSSQGAPTGRVGVERGAWGGTKGWRSRGRSGRDLHPPPCPRRGVPAVKSWLHAPASPKRARGFQHPSLCRRARTAVPLAGVICSEGGTHGRDRGTTQQGLEIHGLPGGSGRGGGGDKTPRDIEAQRKGHYPPRPQAHTHAHRASQSTQGSQHPALLARGWGLINPNLRRGLGGLPRGQKGLSSRQEQARRRGQQGKQQQGEEIIPRGRGTPLCTPYLPASATRTCPGRPPRQIRAAAAKVGARRGCRKDMASR